MDPLWLLAAATVVLAVMGLCESHAHRRNLAQIPIRIHVNGTRGKSSVTRLIAAGLRAAGVRTCAKTTGTLARMILSDGTELPVFRPSRPNVIEQVRILRAAVRDRAQAIVVECMALQPALQWLSEEKLVRATHAVITNARADHLEVMGPTEADVARALGGMIPPRATLYLADRRHREVYEEIAAERGTVVHAITDADVAEVSDEDLAGFSYVEHAENVALALAVCSSLGIDRRTALEGMWKARPDPGVMTAHDLDFFGRRIHFVNGFAANDPESTERVWNMAIARFPDAGTRIAIFNCRADRPDRSVQLARACVEWTPADVYVLIGTGTYIFAKHATDAGLDVGRIVFAEGRRVDEIFELVLERCGDRTLVMGMGNIGGPGLDLVRHFRNRSRPGGAASAAARAADAERIATAAAG